MFTGYGAIPIGEALFGSSAIVLLRCLFLTDWWEFPLSSHCNYFGHETSVEYL